MLHRLKDSMEQNGGMDFKSILDSRGLCVPHILCPSGLVDDQLLVKVVKDKLMSKPCRNQGFVLDGFPKTYEQATELFNGGTPISKL